jgi:putative hydrolase of the HAD superfamily
MALRAVTLDAAGTLFDVAEPVGVTYARFARRHGIALAADQAERSFRAAFAAAPPLAFPADRPPRVADHEQAWWRAVVERTFGATAAQPGFEACFAELFAHFGSAQAWRVFPEVPGTLAALRQRGLRLAVVSNFDERLDGIVAGLGLAPQIDAIMPSTRAGAAKPAPAIFHAALARLGVRPREALHAGDGLHVDVEGARAAGLHAVLVDRTGARPEVPPGARVISTLVDLTAVTDTIDAA